MDYSTHNNGDAQKRWKPPPMDIKLTCAAASTVFMHPIGTIKVRMQMGMGSNILRSQGFGTLSKGFSAGLLRKLSYIAFLDYSPRPSSAVSSTGNARLVDITSPIARSSVAALVLNPLDVAATRMQGDAALHPDLRRNYRNVLQAIYRAAADEGLLALWRGTCPHVLAMWGSTFGFITAGLSYRMILHNNVKYNRETTFIGGCFLGLILPAVISQPFDYVKTQMQMMQVDSRGRYPYTSSLDCARKTLKLGGPLKFYTGFAAYSLTISPQLLLILWLQHKAQGMKMSIKT